MMSDRARSRHWFRKGWRTRAPRAARARRRRGSTSALVESPVYDYRDTGKAVSLVENAGGALVTRPNTLRRVLTNPVDNVIKYGGGAAELSVRRDRDVVIIAVMDRGGGIPEDKLEAVLQPFVRLEASRNRETGGTGLACHRSPAGLGHGRLAEAAQSRGRWPVAEIRIG